ncbi:uncharacterized protein LOC144869815 isoform X2 [Branchiostoma floridae x Branchiostoma japonicum]
MMSNSKKENGALRQRKTVPVPAIHGHRHMPIPGPIPPPTVMGSHPLPPIRQQRQREGKNEKVKKPGASDLKDTQPASKSTVTADRYTKTSGNTVESISEKGHHREKLPQIKHEHRNKVRSIKSSRHTNAHVTRPKSVEVQQIDGAIAMRNNNNPEVERNKGETEFAKRKKDSTAVDRSQAAKSCKPAKRSSSQKIAEDHQKPSLRTSRENISLAADSNEKMATQFQERALNPVALTSTKEMEEEWLKALSKFAHEGMRQIDNMGAIKTDERATPMMVEQSCIGSSFDPAILDMKDVNESDVRMSQTSIELHHKEKEVTGTVKTTKRAPYVASVQHNNPNVNSGKLSDLDCRREENRMQRIYCASPQLLGREDNGGSYGVHRMTSDQESNRALAETLSQDNSRAPRHPSSMAPHQDSSRARLQESNVAPHQDGSRAPRQESNRALHQDSSRAPHLESNRAPRQDSSREPGQEKILRRRNSHKTGKQLDETSLPSLATDAVKKGKKRCKPGVTLPSIVDGKRALCSAAPPDMPDGRIDTELPPLEFGTKQVGDVMSASVADDCSKDKSKVGRTKRRQKVDRAVLKDKNARHHEY